MTPERMDTPAEFVTRCVDAAADLALLFVGEPEEKMLATLQQTRANLEAELSESFGPDMAAAVAQAFVKAVIGRRREIEAAAGGTPVSI
jgi:hypothetical protein